MAILLKIIDIRMSLSAVLLFTSISGCISGQPQIQKPVKSQVQSQNKTAMASTKKATVTTEEQTYQAKDLREEDMREEDTQKQNNGQEDQKVKSQLNASSKPVSKIDNKPIINTYQQRKTSKISGRHGNEVSPANLKYSKILEGTATAYTHTGYNTATGIKPYRGVVSVDPKVIPLGSKVFIEGYGVAVAADTGGAMRGTKIDVFFETKEECYKWGRRKVKIYLLENN